MSILGNLDILAPILPVETMIELGNKRTKELVWKDHFESMGISHTSIDLNGKDGALRLDLNFPIDLPPADVVTNFGTSEHVSNQEACFDNIDRLSKKWIVHQVPLIGNWKGHGGSLGMECFKYSEDDFFKMSMKYIYEIDDMFISGRPTKKLINVRFLKRREK
jgi:hypothetical protein